jgi:hypothetical protein
LHKRLEMVKVQGPLRCLPYDTVLYSTLQLFMLMGTGLKPTTQSHSSTKTVLWTLEFGDVKKKVQTI